MSYKCYDWTKYKKGLHLLKLRKDKEDELIKMLECSFEDAERLEIHELNTRRYTLKSLFGEYSEILKKECYELFFVIGMMESNYCYILELKKDELSL